MELQDVTLPRIPDVAAHSSLRLLGLHNGNTGSVGYSLVSAEKGGSLNIYYLLHICVCEHVINVNSTVRDFLSRRSTCRTHLSKLRKKHQLSP